MRGWGSPNVQFVAKKLATSARTWRFGSSVVTGVMCRKSSTAIARIFMA
jgi:hypothetical protein